MKKIAAVLVVVLFTSSYAMGGVVSFSQTSADPFVNPGDGPTQVTFDITWVSTTFVDGAMSMDLFIGSDTGPAFDMTVGDLDAEFTGAFMMSDVSDPDPFAHYADGIYISALTFGAPVLPDVDGILLGQMTVDANGLTADTDYLFYVHGESELAGTVSGSRDPLTVAADGLVHTVPEPATLSLLVLGTVGLIRRRMAA